MATTRRRSSTQRESALRVVLSIPVLSLWFVVQTSCSSLKDTQELGLLTRWDSVFWGNEDAFQSRGQT